MLIWNDYDMLAAAHVTPPTSAGFLPVPVDGATTADNLVELRLRLLLTKVDATTFQTMPSTAVDGIIPATFGDKAPVAGPNLEDIDVV